MRGSYLPFQKVNQASGRVENGTKWGKTRGAEIRAHPIKRPGCCPV